MPPTREDDSICCFLFYSCGDDLGFRHFDLESARARLDHRETLGEGVVYEPERLSQPSYNLFDPDRPLM